MIFSRSTLLAIAATLPSAFAHYNFEALIVNGNISSPYQYVRKTTNSNSPITDVTSTDMICNAGGISSDIMSSTETATVSPGDELGFTVNNNLGHPGPLSLWMSKAPDGTAANAYTGDGDWFKVYELTTSSITSEGLQWATYLSNGAGATNFTFQLPEDLPSGDYLLRAEHVALHAAQTVGGAQFYIGCAQLSVGGSGSGTPSPTTKIPGMYTGTEPGLQINIYYPPPQNYTPAGPVTWPGACVDHTINLDGQTSDGDCNDDSSNSTTPATSSAASSAVATSTSAASSTSTKVSSATSVAGSSSTSSASVATTTSAAKTTAVADATSSSSAAATASSTATPKTACRNRRALRARRASRNM